MSLKIKWQIAENRKSAHLVILEKEEEGIIEKLIPLCKDARVRNIKALPNFSKSVKGDSIFMMKWSNHEWVEVFSALENEIRTKFPDVIFI